jgi:hypothetical protein
MAGIARRHGVDLDTDRVALGPAAVAGLPVTASGGIGADLAQQPITATRFALIPVDETLRVAVYHVDPLTNSRFGDVDVSDAHPPPVPAEVVRQAIGVLDDVDALPGSHVAREGARREILGAVQAVLARSGASTFALAEVIAEMTRRGSGYPESTIRTMVTSHLCRNAPNHAATTYDDLERVGRGIYRRTTN